jgi:hypothetical protein
MWTPTTTDDAARMFDLSIRDRRCNDDRVVQHNHAGQDFGGSSFLKFADA